MRRLKSFAIRCCRRTPIISGFPELSRGNFFDALGELFFTVLLSTFPLWCGAFIASLAAVSSDSIEKEHQGGFLYTLFKYLYHSVSTGDLIIYSAALIAPVIYIASKEMRSGGGSRAFPSRPWHILFATLVQIFGTAFFTMQFLNHKMNPEYAFTFSVVLFPVTLLMLLIAFCYKNMIDEMDPLEEARISEENFRANYVSRRGEAVSPTAGVSSSSTFDGYRRGGGSSE